MEGSIKNGASFRQYTTAALKALICDLLDFPEEEFHLFQYKAAIEYLEVYLPDDPSAVHILSSSCNFWQWWRMYWSARDFVFLSNISPGSVEARAISRKLYVELHNPTTLASSLSPWGSSQPLTRDELLQLLNESLIK